MSRFDYSKNPVVKRVDTVTVETKNHMDILTNNDLNRVQKVTAIRDEVRSCYSDAYREVNVRFVDGVIEDLIKTSKLEGRPLPEVLVFEVELHMPLVKASDVPVKLKHEYRDYKEKYRNETPPTWRSDNDHIYWS